MSVYKRGDVWWYKFQYAGRFIRESVKSTSKTVARDAERRRRRELEEGYNDLSDRREERVQAVSALAIAYLDDYKTKHSSGTFAEYAIGHVCEHLGTTLVVDVSVNTVKRYQITRLREKAAPKSINEEVGFLLRILGQRGDAIRAGLRREQGLKLRVRNDVGKAYTQEDKQRLLTASTLGRAAAHPETNEIGHTRSRYIRPALALAFNSGMRDAEIRTLTWTQINFERRFLVVGKSKTEAGEGRTIPLNSALVTALTDHASWYTSRFGAIEPEWFLFPGRIGKPTLGVERPLDPTRPVTSLKTAWRNVKKRAGVTGRFHDTRHTLVTELAESGAGDQTIMDIAGHVSRQMLSRYSHIRMEAKRRALEVVGTATEADRSNKPAVDIDHAETRPLELIQ